MIDETGHKTSRRYPISFKLRYVLPPNDAERTGAGETLWMSGKEVAFLAKAAGAVGEKIQLNIAWPVLLHGAVPLQLIVNAEILQSSGPLTIARLTKHEFRTRAIQSPVPVAKPWQPPIAPESYPSRRMPYLDPAVAAPALRAASSAFR
jgi:hypothetical protein